MSDVGAYCWADGPVAAVGVLEAELAQLEAEVQTVQDQSFWGVTRWMSSLPSTAFVNSSHRSSHPLS